LLWNNLSRSLTDISLHAVFKHELKAHLLQSLLVLLQFLPAIYLSMDWKGILDAVFSLTGYRYLGDGGTD